MSLLELLLVLVLLGIVGAMVTTMMVAASRTSARAVAQLAAERTTQVTAAFLRHELAGTGWREVQVGPDSIAMPRPVGGAAVCDSSGTFLWIRRSAWDGDRAPDPSRDRLVVWPEGGTVAAREALHDVAASSCPDAAPAWRLERGGAGAVAEWIRVEEPTTVRRYRAGDGEWLGLRGAGAPVQPFAGPLRVGDSRFARIGDVLQLDLVFDTGSRRLALPLVPAP